MVRVPESVAEIAHSHESALEAKGHRLVQGAFYTPLAIAEKIVDLACGSRMANISGPESVPRVIDPSCGTGTFLMVLAVRMAERLVQTGLLWTDAISYVVSSRIHGVDIDPDAVDLCRRQLSELTNGAVSPTELAEHIVVANPLHDRAALCGFDIVIGNPPFLDQQSRSTAVSRADHALIARTFGGRAIRVNRLTNPASLFMLAAMDMVSDSGIVAMIQPMSFLTARDSQGVRSEIASSESAVEVWMTRETVFDAAVHVCAVVLDFARARSVTVWVDGEERVIRRTSLLHDSTWAFASAVMHEVPVVDVASTRTLSDICEVTADFRDQYYGLVGHVVEDHASSGNAMRLVTSGLIDPFACLWGSRTTRFARVGYVSPVVDPARLTSQMGEWARSRAVPKVLVATQTRALEAVVDPEGDMLPSVPVLSAMPSEGVDIWMVLAAVMSPVVSVVAAQRHLGAGLSPGAIKLSASDLGRLPVPNDEREWRRGAEMARQIQDDKSSSLADFGEVMCAAHGLDRGTTAAVMAWWLPRVSR